ncbi:hypothetical protein B5X24_HaOG212859 [Helicoverpa armigera]|uniref:Uncharacterized protein n=1 Tax=Helicoverpa armigera TaxID=29058 RepID=A0A2W1BCM9_HELAM|nr:hypothetical protein B5X24_HaOG212859 [Helicoverpa armigera]
MNFPHHSTSLVLQTWYPITMDLNFCCPHYTNDIVRDFGTGLGKFLKLGDEAELAIWGVNGKCMGHGTLGSNCLPITMSRGENTKEIEK